MELNLSMNTSDYECREYLASIRWKNGFTCPRCGCAEAWETKEVKYKCKKCGMCLKPGCPALTKNEDGTIAIDETMCNGCGLCKQLCKFDAIDCVAR